MLFVGFSPVVKASEIDLPLHHIYTTAEYVLKSGSAGTQALGTFYPGASDEVTLSKGWTTPGATSTSVVKHTIISFYIANSNGNALISSKGTYDFTLQHLYAHVLYKDATTGKNVSSDRKPTSVSVRVQYMDNSVSYGTAEIINSIAIAPIFDIQGTFTSTKPVKQIQIDVLFNTIDTVTVNGLAVEAKVEYKNETYFQLSVDEQDPNTGLLSSLVSKVTSGFSDIGNWFSNLGNSISTGFSDLIDTVTGFFTDARDFFTNIINTVIELPAKLWKLIEDGLKSLFIPSEVQLAAIYANAEERMSDRLGVLWQVTTIINDFDNVFSDVKDGTITIPKVTIPLGADSFSFGGYEVQIVPDGFDQILSVAKTLINIVLTLAYINVCRKWVYRFFE